MGSYFGSSLCAVDLNQDGLSDLLVGAPMHSQLRDEGQVSVYLSRGNFGCERALLGLHLSLTAGSFCLVSSPCEIHLKACSQASAFAFVHCERWQLGIITHPVTHHSWIVGKSQMCLLTDR
ncbi:hypothetical protein GOODEAATRI_004291 [Goodea atripinnis]|uniref:Uncharacterized protein n=1 Tax=Goodea atripinnis TaxID=208336 RepID=A0ABV0MYK1_9TELE